MIPLPIIDRVLMRLGFGSPQPIRRRRTFKGSRTRRARKTPVKTFKPNPYDNPYGVFNVDRKRAPVRTYEGTPIKTFGTGLEKSSDVYKTPGISEQRIAQVQAEIAKEEQREAEEFESITKTYEKRLQADKLRLSHGDFGSLHNGIGLTSPRIKNMIAQWESEQRALERSMAPPSTRPYNQQSPIKMGHSLRPA